MSASDAITWPSLADHSQRHITMHLPVQYLLPCLGKLDLKIIRVTPKNLCVPPRKNILDPVSEMRHLKSSYLLQPFILRPRVGWNLEDSLYDVYEACIFQHGFPLQWRFARSSDTLGHIKVALRHFDV